MLKRIQQYFDFSKKELNGLLVLCGLIGLIGFAPLIFSYFYEPEIYNDPGFEREVALFKSSALKKRNYLRRNYESRSPISNNRSTELFKFNPNQLPFADWRRLGLSDRQIKIIKNYEAKGGRFYRKEDLKKIYSISEADYSRLEAFVDIPALVYQNNNKAFAKENRSTTHRTLPVIDINTADSAQFETLNGIGPAFASRIVRYRNKLGGFYRKEQLLEVYGLDSVLYSKIQGRLRAEDKGLRKISVNSNDPDKLKHPYLNYRQINAILIFRRQHGFYKQIGDLRKVLVLDEPLLQKISPYLSFE